MKLEHIITLVLAAFFASGTASAVGAAVNETELFIIGFGIAEGSPEEENLKDMAEQMGGSYISAEDATTAADLEVALTRSFAGIHGGTTEKVPRLEIRGPVATVEDGAYYNWGPNDFAGFYYDTDGDIGAESITMYVTNGNTLEEDCGVVYKTCAERDDLEYEEWGLYRIISFLGEEYFAAYVEDECYLSDDSTDTNLLVDEQLTKVLINDDEERTFTTGTPLTLAGGYELVIQEIDVDNNWVYVELMKNGKVIDTDVVEPSKDGATIEDETYTYKNNIGDTNDIVIIAVHFKNAIHLKTALDGKGQDLATVNGIWQISDSPIEVKEGARYGKMTVLPEDPEHMDIVMCNKDEKITLWKNRDIPLMGDIRIKTADQDDISVENPLRFYIYKEITEPGTYEVRGTVRAVFDGDTAELDVSSFAGFYYDIDDNLGNERITMTITRDFLDEPEGIVYETTAQQDDFDFEDWGEFWTIAFLGEEYFAAYVGDTPETAYLADDSTDTNLLVDEQLTKVLINDDEERNFITGTPLTLANGYELVIQEIDVDNGVYVQLMKDGQVVDSAVVEPSKDGATIWDKTYTHKVDLGDTRDIVVIAVHFKNAIHLKSSDQDLATVDGIWQISETPIKTEEDTEYGKMAIWAVNPETLTIVMHNEDNKITLNKNKDTHLIGDIWIKAAEGTRLTPHIFYIYKMVTVESQDSGDEDQMVATNATDALG